MSLVTGLDGRLVFAIPKKGRLQQPTLDLLAGSDIQFRRESRRDIALVLNHDIALVFLPAADIPLFVARGHVDLGITGRDQVLEHEAVSPATENSGVVEVLDLGFGRCRLQVQVPATGSINEPKDLLGKNIVTSYDGLTRRYFARLEVQEGLSNEDVSGHGQLKTKIDHASGSVETACALGVADGIVDLVESGETMRVAGLKAIDTVIESTAVLIKSKYPLNQRLVDLIASRISGVITAQKYVLCQYNIERSLLDTASKITPGKTAPTITTLEKAEWVAVSAMVESKRIATVMDELTACGATDVLVLKIENTRTR